MPSQIDRSGTFRGVIQEHAIGSTKNGFPQFVATLKATQMYVDDATQFEGFGITEAGWVDWSSYDQDITGYIILAYNDKKTGNPVTSFQVEPVMRATGWCGSSYAKLAALTLSGKEITFWMVWNTNPNNGDTRLQVDAIDAADASPNRTLRALDAAGLKDLDSRFAGVLLVNTAPVAAAKAPTAVKPTTLKAPAPAKPAAPASKAPAAKGPPAKPAAKSDKEVEPKFPSTMTMDEAWTVVEARTADFATDDGRAEAWITASDSIAPKVDANAITGEQWYHIALAAIKALQVAANQVAV